MGSQSFAGDSMSETHRFLKIDDVLDRLQIGKTKLYDMIQKGEFPKPVKIGGASRWPDTALRQWQDKKMEVESG